MKVVKSMISVGVSAFGGSIGPSSIGATAFLVSAARSAFDVYNLLNDQKLLASSTTERTKGSTPVNPDSNSPRNELDLATGFTRAAPSVPPQATCEVPPQATCDQRHQ